MINFETAGALVLGENIGTTITAWLASLGASTNAKRAAYAHICFNTLGVAWITTIALPLYFPLIGRIIGHDPNTMIPLADGEQSYPYIMAAIAAVHTGFNTANTILFLPFVKQLAQLVSFIVPEKSEKPETPHLTYLDVRMLDTPSISILQSHKQILFMAEHNREMLEKLNTVLESEKPNPELEQSIFQSEQILDNVQKEVMLFLSELISGQVPHEVTEKARGQMRMADEYESVSDYAANVLKGLRKLRSSGLKLTPEGLGEIKKLNTMVLDYLRKVESVVRSEDEKAATQLLPLHSEITHAIKEFRQNHLTRLSEGKVTPLNSLIFTDLLNFYRRIKDHTLNIAEVVAGEK
jgi:phosphate:Na+ symporter